MRRKGSFLVVYHELVVVKRRAHLVYNRATNTRREIGCLLGVFFAG